MCTSRAGRREAFFAAFVFLCLLKYTLPTIAGLENLGIINPDEEEEGEEEREWEENEEGWEEEGQEGEEEEEEVSDWSRCFVVEHVLK